jgi:hypothetical protein
MKITQERQKQGSELMQLLLENSWKSDTFKKQLIKEPISTIETLTGSRIGENAKFIVEDQTDRSVIYFNIPSEPNFDELELTEEQLEMIAGGITPTVLVTAAYVGGMALGAGATYVIGKYLL